MNGYRAGKRDNSLAHVTLLGGGITGVLKAMLTPSIVLRDFPRYEECKNVQPDRPYPLDLYLDLLDFINAKLSRAVVLKMGRSVAREIISVSLSSLQLRNPSEAIAAIQQAHLQFCKPPIGEFAILDERANKIMLKYTAPYDCVLQEGLFYEIAVTYGGSRVDVVQRECRKDGAPACIFDINYR